MKKMSWHVALNKLSKKYPLFLFPNIEKEFVTREDFITSVCPSHGASSVKASVLFSGTHGCRKCARESQVKKRKTPIDSLPLHPEYSYPLIQSEYKNNKSVLTVFCKDHGNFYPSAQDHFGKKKTKCPFCSAKKAADIFLTLPMVTALSRLQDRWKNKYSYPFFELEYDTVKSKITACCLKHGNFQTLYADHYGKLIHCPTCSHHMSKGENEVLSFVKGLGMRPIGRAKKIIGNKEIDIWLPEKNLAIEYNGLFHHCSDRVGKSYHKIKRKMCEERGIRLIQIWEDEWIFNREKVESYLKNALGVTPNKLFARKCKLETISKEEGDKFFEENHLQGKGPNGGDFIGLRYGEYLVALTQFRKGYSGKIELVRNVSLLNTSVVGGFQKILGQWRKENPNAELISFINYDKFSGNGYAMAGFKKTGESQTMWFKVGNRRVSREKFKKDPERNCTQKIFNSGVGRYSLSGTF